MGLLLKQNIKLLKNLQEKERYKSQPKTKSLFEVLKSLILLGGGVELIFFFQYFRTKHQSYNKYYLKKKNHQSLMNFNLEIIPFQERINPQPISKILAEPQSLQKPKKKISKIDQKEKIVKLDKRVKSTWTLAESKRYLKFLIQSQHHLELGKEKRRLKLNVKMSKVIKSRDPSQCHSHHQKMLIKYGSVAEILNYLNSTVGETVRASHKAQDTMPKQVLVPEKQCFEHVFKMDFQLPPLFLEERQEQFMELRLMQIESFQYNKGEGWDNCFV